MRNCGDVLLETERDGTEAAALAVAGGENEADVEWTGNVESAMRAAAVLGLAISAIQYEAADVAPVDFAEDEDDDPLADSVRWMKARGVMSTADLDRILSRGTAIRAAMRSTEFEQQVRREVLVLKEAANLDITRGVKDRLEKALDAGQSQAEFVETLKAEIADGAVSGDWYASTVYRTESANAYSAARREWESQPEIEDALWGWRVQNPDDDRSRESHGRLNGAMFKKGSAAERALGDTPFSYNCRCVRVPLFVRDVDGGELQETPNALALANQVERF